MFYKKEVLKQRKKENLFLFILISLIISICSSLILSEFFIKIYKVSNLVKKDQKPFYYIVNIFSSNFKENDYVIGKIHQETITIGKILAKGPATITVTNDEIFLDNKKIFLKNPLPTIFYKNQKIHLNKEEYFILSEISLDSFYLGKIPKNQIIGKILYSF
jgi:type IV secretory pathway protease TraF